MMQGYFIKAVVGICCLTMLGALVLAGTVQASRELFAPFSAVITIAGVLAAVFNLWAWRWCIFAWVVNRPDLRGTWRGEIVSSWVNSETGSTLPPIPAFMVVTQTATELHLRQFTAESPSSTLSATIRSEDDDAKCVVGVYRGEPGLDVRHRSEIHFGALRLNLSAPDELTGEYWTDRGTKGQMKLRRISRKKASSFDHAKTMESQAPGGA